MTKPTLYNMIREYSSFHDDANPQIFLHEGHIVWFHGKMAVIDDPNLINHFGEYFFNHFLNPNKSYFIEAKRSKIHIVGENEPIPYLKDFKDHFNLDVSECKDHLKYLGKIKPRNFKEQQGFLNIEAGTINLVDPEKFDYVKSIGGSVNIHSLNPLHFYKEGNLIALISSQRFLLESFEGEDLKTIEALLENST